MCRHCQGIYLPRWCVLHFKPQTRLNRHGMLRCCRQGLSVSVAISCKDCGFLASAARTAGSKTDRERRTTMPPRSSGGAVFQLAMILHLAAFLAACCQSNGLPSVLPSRTSRLSLTFFCVGSPSQKPPSSRPKLDDIDNSFIINRYDYSLPGGASRRIAQRNDTGAASRRSYRLTASRGRGI